MQISLKIDDSYYQQFLDYIKTLPANTVKILAKDAESNSETLSFKKTQQYQKDRAYFHDALDEIENGKVTALSHDEVWEKIEKHTKES